MELKRGLDIFAVYGPTDMRKQITGLANIISSFSEKRLYDGNYYVFCSRNRQAIKILYYDNRGFCLWHKKYEKEYQWPIFRDKGLIEISRADLEAILNGKNIWNRKTTKEKPKQKKATEQEQQKQEKKTTEKRKGGFNKIMIRPFPDKETLAKVIKERESGFDQEIITGFVYDGPSTFYVDRKGLVHDSGPRGKIVSFVGWTEEQMKSMEDDNTFAPMPR
jgi:hypothetical protein